MSYGVFLISFMVIWASAQAGQVETESHFLPEYTDIDTFLMPEEALDRNQNLSLAPQWHEGDRLVVILREDCLLTEGCVSQFRELLLRAQDAESKRVIIVRDQLAVDDTRVEKIEALFKAAGATEVSIVKGQSPGHDWLVTHARHYRQGKTVSMLLPPTDDTPL